MEDYFQLKIQEIKLCPSCKEKMVQIVRISANKRQETQNTSHVCINPKCLMRINLEKVDTWKIID